MPVGFRCAFSATSDQDAFEKQKDLYERALLIPVTGSPPAATPKREFIVSAESCVVTTWHDSTADRDAMYDAAKKVHEARGGGISGHKIDENGNKSEVAL